MRPLGNDVSQQLTTSAAGQNLLPPPAKSEEKRIAPAGLPETDLYVGPPGRPASGNTTPIELAPEAPRAVVLKDQAVLLYNGECSVCRKISSWVIAQDDPKNGGQQKIDERPIGSNPEALKAIHPELDIWQAYETIHVVMPNGEIKRGGEAVAEVLRRIPETRWFTPLFDVSLFGWKPFQSMLNGAYFVLDRLRPAMGCESCGTPVPWWGKPIEWTYKAWKAIFG